MNAPCSSRPRARVGRRALVRRSVAGDMRAFEQLYRGHVGRVHGAILRLVGMDRARAEELTQDAFVRAWQKLSSFRHESAFSTWLHRLGVNTALMDLRGRREETVCRRRRRWNSPPAAKCRSAPASAAISNAPFRRCRHARAPCWYCTTSKAGSTRKLPSELGMAVGSSKAQLHRARGLLRRALGGEGMNNEFEWRNQMRKLSGPVEPARDLWPAIAARIAAAGRRMRRRGVASPPLDRDCGKPRHRRAARACTAYRCSIGKVRRRSHRSRADRRLIAAKTRSRRATALDWAMPADPALTARDADSRQRQRAAGAGARTAPRRGVPGRAAQSHQWSAHALAAAGALRWINLVYMWNPL